MVGSPQNWDASPGKHNLIDFAKHPAQNTKTSQYFYDACYRSSAGKCCFGKSISLFRNAERETENDVDELDDAKDLVVKSYGLIVMENGNHKFVLHGRSHMQKQKFIHLW